MSNMENDKKNYDYMADPKLATSGNFALSSLKITVIRPCWFQRPRGVTR